MTSNVWPALPLDEWQPTYATLHMWTQIVGKIRLALTPRINHWWNTTFRVSSRGFTTLAIPYEERAFTIEFDFIAHELSVTDSAGSVKTLALTPRSVAQFYREVMTALHELGIAVKIWPVPVEIPNPIPFEQDHQHASYDPEQANRFWQIQVQLDKLFTEFRARFIGKCSPVHFFWGSFDLAVTRFSGRRAPEREGLIMREAYSHEVISHGFWPGSGAIQRPALYAYAAPEPAGFREAAIRPATTFYSAEMGTFILPYDDVRTSRDPAAMVLDFLQSTYEAGANLAAWNRAELERSSTPPR